MLFGDNVPLQILFLLGLVVVLAFAPKLVGRLIQSFQQHRSRRCPASDKRWRGWARYRKSSISTQLNNWKSSLPSVITAFGAARVTGMSALNASPNLERGMRPAMRVATTRWKPSASSTLRPQSIGPGMSPCMNAACIATTAPAVTLKHPHLQIPIPDQLPHHATADSRPI